MAALLTQKLIGTGILLFLGLGIFATAATIAGAQVTSISISGNGYGSTNNASINQTSSTTINQSNNSNVNTNINVSSNTGGNRSNNNTGGSSNITTGNSTSNVSITISGDSNTSN